MSIPIRILNVVTLWRLYLNAIGNNSSIEIKIIIPATNESINAIENSILLNKGNISNNAIIAPQEKIGASVRSSTNSLRIYFAFLLFIKN